MELTEDEIIQRYAKKCGYCHRKTLLPYEVEWSCLLCGFNLIKQKHELSKIQRKKNFVYRLKYAEQKKFVFVHMYIKFMKLIIMINYTKFYQH